MIKQLKKLMLEFLFNSEMQADYESSAVTKYKEQELEENTQKDTPTYCDNPPEDAPVSNDSGIIRQSFAQYTGSCEISQRNIDGQLILYTDRLVFKNQKTSNETTIYMVDIKNVTPNSYSKSISINYCKAKKKNFFVVQNPQGWAKSINSICCSISEHDRTLFRAMSYMSMNEYKKAIWEWTVLINSGGETAQAYTERASAYLHTKKYKFCINDCISAIEKFPNDKDSFLVFFILGNCLCETGDVQQALDNSSKSIILKPDFPYSYYTRGCCYHLLGNYLKSYNDFCKFLELTNNNEEEFYYRAMNFKTSLEEEFHFDRTQKEENDNSVSGNDDKNIPPKKLPKHCRTVDF